MATESLLPNSNGSFQQVSHQAPPSGFHFTKVDDLVGSPDYSTTAVYSKTNVPGEPPTPTDPPPG